VDYLTAFSSALGVYGELIIAFFTVVVAVELARFGVELLRGGGR
jgi:hypothetical protein